MKIITAGRTDFDNFFKLSAFREYKKLSHRPVLIFRETPNQVQVEIIEKTGDLLLLPPETKCMTQWSGEWRSDFIQFTIGELLEYIKKNPKESYQYI